MAYNNKYVAPVFKDKGGWRWRVAFTPSYNFDATSFTELDLGAVIVADSMEFVRKFIDGEPYEFPEIPTASFSIYCDLLPDYVKQRIVAPAVSRTFLTPGESTDVTLSNIWTFETDAGDGTLYEAAFSAVFSGTQNLTAEDVYQQDDAGRTVLTLELEDVRPVALRNMPIRQIANELWDDCGADSTLYHQDTVLIESYWTDGATTFAHYCGTGEDRITLFKFSALFDVINRVYNEQMQALLRTTDTFTLDFSEFFSAVTLREQAYDVTDSAGGFIDDPADEMYFVGAIQPVALTGLQQPVNWIGGLLSEDEDSFVGDGYTTAWDLLRRLAMNFFVKVSLTNPLRFDFTQIQKGFHDSPIIVNPELSGKPEIRRGGNIATRAEVVLKGATDGDRDTALFVPQAVTKNESQIDAQTIFTNCPTLAGGLSVAATTPYIQIQSAPIHTRGLYYLDAAVEAVTGASAVRVHASTTLDNGNSTFSVSADAHTLPETGMSAADILETLLAVYTLVQQQAGIANCLAEALYTTYSKYNQCIIKADVPRADAAFYYVGERATIDLTNYTGGMLTPPSTDSILISCTTNTTISQCEFLTRGL